MQNKQSDIEKQLIKIFGKKIFQGSDIGSKIGKFAYSEIFNLMNFSERELEKFTISNRTIREKIGNDENIIPKVFGRTRVNGRIIWQSEIYSEVDYIGLGKYEKYANVYCHLAVAICDGPIDSLEKIYINDKKISKNSLDFIFYNGDENQIPDDFLQSETNNRSPAYKGLAYLVIKNFYLNKYEGNIPKFSFEVISNNYKLDKLRGINLIPGSGEDVYNTKIQFKVNGTYINEDFYIDGKSTSTNCHNDEGKSNVEISIGQLLYFCPNIEYIFITVNWFASSLDIENCEIYPAVEYKYDAETMPDAWSVNEIKRKDAKKIINNILGRPLYGGTPSDISLIRLIQYLKSLNIKVFINPIILLELLDKPWRGKITGNPIHLSNFFYKKRGYREFILHYASLTKDLVDGFLIGSEMAGITQLKYQNKFVAVEELINLARDVRNIFNNDNVKITYGANWCEYHGANNEYNLDALWSSDDISFVGISAYFPVTDSAIFNKNFTKKEIFDGWTSGEGYEYFYNEERTEKYLFQNKKDAWKNIEFWWANEHFLEDGTPTSWLPKMKKIWFTEFGYASVNCSTNQPNIFIDLDNENLKYPYFSNGSVDFYIQKTAIEATLEKWIGSNFIEEMILWSWDARPYPNFPDLTDVWQDGKNWHLSHSINGKIEKIDISSIVENLIKSAGISNIESDSLEERICGLTVTTMTPKQIIESLCICSSLVVFEDDFKIKIGSKIFDEKKLRKIYSNDILCGINNRPSFLTSFQPIENSCSNINFTYIERKNEYKSKSIEINNDILLPSTSVKVEIVLDDWYANKIANSIVQYGRKAYELYKIKVPFKYVFFSVNDYINLIYNNREILFRIKKIIIENKTIMLEGKRDDQYLKKIGNFNFENYKEERNKITNDDNLQFEIVETNALPEEEFFNIKIIPKIFSRYQEAINIEISLDNGSTFEQTTKILEAPIFGIALGKLQKNVSPNFIDKKSKITIVMSNGSLSSLNYKDFMQNKNMAMIGEEIVHFQYAKKTQENAYEISGFLRGQYGTDSEINNHQEEERFILLDSKITRFKLKNNMIDKEIFIRLTKVGSNNILSEKKFVPRGLFFNPFRVANLNLKYDKKTKEIKVSWKYKARINGELKNFTDIKEDNDFNGYMIEIFEDDKLIISKETYENNFIYEKSTDNVRKITAKIAQKSSIFGVGTKKEIQKILTKFQSNCSNFL